MTLLFADGFDVYDDEADVLTAKWTQPTGTLHTFGTTDGRYGGGGIGATAASTVWAADLTGLGVVAGDTLWVSFAYYHDGNGTATAPGDAWVVLRDAGGGSPARMDHDSAGVVYLKDANNATSVTTAAVLQANIWNWVEMKVIMGTNNTTGFIELKINGTVVGTTATNIDTFTGGGALVNVRLSGSNGLWYADDVIINDSAGSNFTTPPGNCRIDTLNVNADSATTDWTGSYTDVDDALGSSDGDTTHIASSTVAQESRFDIASLPDASAAIFAVHPRVKYKKSDSGSRTLRTLIKQGATEALGATLTPTTSYVWGQGDFFYVDPVSSVAFTDSDITDLEVGVEVVA